MRGLVGKLLRFVCALALVFSALPIRAGVVCVVGERVVAWCRMASLSSTPLASALEPPCCRRAGKASCRVLYRKGGTVAAPAKALRFFEPPFGLVPSPFVPPFFGQRGSSPVSPCGKDARPAASVPRAPDRGRAPPRPRLNRIANALKR